MVASLLWLQYNLQQAGFMRIETAEPFRSLFERNHGGEYWLDADRSPRDERNARRILAGRRTGSLHANLPRDNGLETDFNRRS